MKTRYALLACAALTSISNPAVAQSSTDAGQPSTAQAGAVQTPTPAPVAAENDQASGLQDILVTARRTEERLQDVPAAVTGYNSAQIAALNISSFADIGRTVPNLDVQRQFGSSS